MLLYAPVSHAQLVAAAACNTRIGCVCGTGGDGGGAVELAAARLLLSLMSWKASVEALMVQGFGLDLVVVTEPKHA